VRKILLIVQREYAQVVKKKSFIVGILLTPLMMAAFMLLPTWFANKSASDTESLAVIDLGGQGVGRQFAESLAKYKLENSDKAYYKVDQIFEIPPTDTTRYRVVYDSLVQAMTDQGVRYFLEVRPAADKAPNDSLVLVANNEDFKSMGRFETQLSNIVSSMRLKQSSINLPVDSVLKLTAQIDLKRRDTTGNAVSFQVKYFGAMIFVMLIYMMILLYGQTVMRSVIEEKNSRIMEVMMSSVSPFQLMAGKLIGLGAAALTQVAIWIAMALIMMGISGSMAVQMDPSIMRVVFNPLVLVFFALYLISGYFLYSTLFAVIGSLVNTEKEAQNFMWPIVMCLVLPFMIGLSLVQDPNSMLATTMSLIPFFTPTMMMMRIIFVAPTTVSYSLFSGILGQAILGFILVVLAIILMVWIVGKIFRIGILMYGKRPTFPEIVKWVRY
jgi:ABC-2 type transport system permease protein